jgi:hypothetical protein
VYMHAQNATSKVKQIYLPLYNFAFMSIPTFEYLAAHWKHTAMPIVRPPKICNPR